jgi:hypothetical protein
MPRYVNQPNILDYLPNGRLVNSYRGAILGTTYYIYSNKLYKKTKDRRYREVCAQKNRRESKYMFYFIKNKGPYAMMSRINVNKLDHMEFVDEIIGEGIGVPVGVVSDDPISVPKGGESVDGEAH